MARVAVRRLLRGRTQLLINTHCGSPTHDAIALRAYQNFEPRDHKHGHELTTGFRPNASCLGEVRTAREDANGWTHPGDRGSTACWVRSLGRRGS